MAAGDEIFFGGAQTNPSRSLSVNRASLIPGGFCVPNLQLPNWPGRETGIDAMGNFYFLQSGTVQVQCSAL